MILVQRLSTQSSLAFLSIFITNFVFHFHNNPCLGFTINNNFSALPFFLTKHRYCYNQKEEKVSTRRSKAKNNDIEIISTTGTTTAEAFDVNLSTYDFSSKQQRRVIQKTAPSRFKKLPQDFLVIPTLTFFGSFALWLFCSLALWVFCSFALWVF